MCFCQSETETIKRKANMKVGIEEEIMSGVSASGANIGATNVNGGSTGGGTIGTAASNNILGLNLGGSAQIAWSSIASLAVLLSRWTV